jgi:hypothetical protein
MALAAASGSKLEVAAIDLNRHPKLEACSTLNADTRTRLFDIWGMTAVAADFGAQPKLSRRARTPARSKGLRSRGRNR